MFVHSIPSVERKNRLNRLALVYIILYFMHWILFMLSVHIILFRAVCCRTLHAVDRHVLDSTATDSNAAHASYIVERHYLGM